MSRSWWGKLWILVLMTALSAAYIYPTVFQIDPEKSKFPVKAKMNLGLDLQGGLYMVLGVDFNKVYRDVIDRQQASLQERLREKQIPISSVKVVREGLPVDDPHIVLEGVSSRAEDLLKLIKDEFWSLRLASRENAKLELGLSREYRQEIREKTLSQSIEVIRNRIDEFGVAEPSIASQGADRIVVELPGVKEVERAKELIGRTAKLEFRIVNEKDMAPPQVAELVASIEKEKGISFKGGAEQKFSEYVRQINEFAKGKVPEGSEIAFERQRAVSGGFLPEGKIPYLLFSKSEVTGDDLQDAQVQINPEDQRPHVSFSLNPRGASTFEKLTGDHVGDKLAIVLDNIVHSAPVIQTKIGGGRGQITLGLGAGDAVLKEAKDLAIVLRAGALPAQLNFLEQRVIGPSLGQDSIKSGALAAVIGSLAVFVFILIYYRLSGAIAVVSLMINVIFVLATLVGLEATLTLPGIAGIALTVGIAVDSNVVIYERIREELRLGKNIYGAVEHGFSKAFGTILDANVTNAVAAVVLLMYGTGPIKGFAVSLLIGIVTTLFTAIFVCRLLFDAYLRRLDQTNRSTLSI
ncbi:MAG: protein translocase subunit SecD [Bdellovibrionales bacterium]|nr:protein translocase subunit SecD [Bdellovibrionales bacterium]